MAECSGDERLWREKACTGGGEMGSFCSGGRGGWGAAGENGRSGRVEERMAEEGQGRQGARLEGEAMADIETPFRHWAELSRPLTTTAKIYSIWLGVCQVECDAICCWNGGGNQTGTWLILTGAGRVVLLERMARRARVGPRDWVRWRALTVIPASMGAMRLLGRCSGGFPAGVGLARIRG